MLPVCVYKPIAATELLQTGGLGQTVGNVQRQLFSRLFRSVTWHGRTFPEWVFGARATLVLYGFPECEHEPQQAVFIFLAFMERNEALKVCIYVGLVIGLLWWWYGLLW